ncbi:MAG TPA: DUF493 family protein [Rhodanobacteraceae bacterium]|nr:DUF493 family protein [Rhodanobacteraceae bacterium]
MRDLENIEPDEGQGFQFPGSFEITAMGNAGANLRARVPEILRGLGLSVLDASVRERPSREGNYVAVTVAFTCPSREKYDLAHAALRADADIRYTL